MQHGLSETPPTTVHRVVRKWMATEAVRVQKQCEQQAKADLKQHFRILGKRHDQLTNDERVILKRLLGYANLLRKCMNGKKRLLSGMTVVQPMRLLKKAIKDGWHKEKQLTI